MNVSAPPAYEILAGAVSNGLTNPPPYQTTTTPPAKTLAISTVGPVLSTSFAYHPSLADFDISPSDWSLFTADLQVATAPTKSQQALAVLGGIGTAVLIGGPWASPCVWRWILRKQVIGNVKKGLTEDEDGGCGKTENVGAILKRWNAAWADKGIVLSLNVSEKGASVDKAFLAEDAGKSVEEFNVVEGGKKCCRKEKYHSKQKRSCCGHYEVYFSVVVRKIAEAAVEEKTDEKKLSVVISEQDDGVWV